MPDRCYNCKPFCHKVSWMRIRTWMRKSYILCIIAYTTIHFAMLNMGEGRSVYFEGRVIVDETS